jgi:hypothetical protein
MAGWVQKQCSSAFSWTCSKVSELSKVRSFSDLIDWGKKAVSEISDGVSNAVSSLRELFFAESAYEAARQRQRDNREPYTAMYRSMAVADEAKREAEKEQKLSDAHRSNKENAGLIEKQTQQLERITHVAPRFADRKEIEELKIAILTNRIPPEDMPEVRRFLAALADEARSDILPHTAATAAGTGRRSRRAA